MQLSIVNQYDDNGTIRITCLNGQCVVKWPKGTDLGFVSEANSQDRADREFKIHSAIKRSYSSRVGFKVSNRHLKTKMSLDRLDKHEFVDLRWDEKDISLE